MRFDDGVPPGIVAPAGSTVKSMLWTARSWFVNVIVVPDVTERVNGEKLAPLPAPDGIVTEAVSPLLETETLVLEAPLPPVSAYHVE